MSTFGHSFRVTTFGESHCRGVGCIVDGCPPGLPLTESDIQPQLTRRRPGQSQLTTPRNESDRCQILSGAELGFTLGTPIGIFVPNEDQRPYDYDNIDVVPRPSHADFTYLMKYGVKASSGGGRSSARETIGRVAAGAIAEKYLKLSCGVDIVAFVSSVGPVELPIEQVQQLIGTVTREQVDRDPVRCPVPSFAEQMTREILQAKEDKDSIGGTVTCVIRNVPIGLGEPCFDKLEAMLAHAMLSIPATKGFEIGSGFQGCKMRGHVHNDPFIEKKDGRLGTATNWSGGIQGGITNGEPIYFRIAFKPAATIGQAQQTQTYNGKETVLEAKGRHDPCVVPRALPIVEAMAALVLMDALQQQSSRYTLAQGLPLIVSKDNQQENQGARLLMGGGSGKPVNPFFK